MVLHRPDMGPVFIPLTDWPTEASTEAPTEALKEAPKEVPTEIPTNPLTTISIILVQQLDVVRISHGTQIIANTQRKASLPHLAISQKKGD